MRASGLVSRPIRAPVSYFLAGLRTRFHKREMAAQSHAFQKSSGILLNLTVRVLWMMRGLSVVLKGTSYRRSWQFQTPHSDRPARHACWPCTARMAGCHSSASRADAVQGGGCFQRRSQAVSARRDIPAASLTLSMISHRIICFSTKRVADPVGSTA